MNYKITIKGEAYTKYPYPEELDGIRCEDEFSEYFDRDYTFYGVVNDGYMRFEYSDGKLWTITEYKSTRLLTDNELSKLANYTQGQWSDGIGEGFEQFPCMEVNIPYRQLTEEEELIYDDEPFTTEVFISPWHDKQILTVTQDIIDYTT